jgi:hypothetical protein
LSLIYFFCTFFEKKYNFFDLIRNKQSSLKELLKKCTTLNPTFVSLVFNW